MPCNLGKDPAFQKIAIIEEWRGLLPELDDLDRRYEVLRKKHELAAETHRLITEKLGHITSHEEYVLGLLDLFHQGLISWRAVQEFSQLSDWELKKYNKRFLSSE